MSVSKFHFVNNAATFSLTILTIILGLYAFIPELSLFAKPITKTGVESLLDKHESYVSNGNIAGMLSQCHPGFILYARHSTGNEESFDKSQILKHQEMFKRILNLDVKKKSRQITIISNTQALVSVTFSQSYSIKGSLTVHNEELHQSMVIVKEDDELKILKVLSIAT